MTTTEENRAESIPSKEGIDENSIIRRISLVGIVGNVALSAFKLFAGISGNSGAMVSDAVHSLSDVFATFIAFLGVRLSKKAADKEHPYGHERFECVASPMGGNPSRVRRFYSSPLRHWPARNSIRAVPAGARGALGPVAMRSSAAV